MFEYIFQAQHTLYIWRIVIYSYSVYWVQFHNHLIRFNPIHFMQNYTYFKQLYQESLTQNK